ncbi:sulfotransferase domain-containing protein [Micromonospora globbae]|uniref:Sulfotransferase domain-containing protein n=1 Tax=Micromonospora globbae TaxID=1894969 RepID=A0A420ESC8_9ACTN|nr:sulfotransferase domain-containing protein [Micromonospora globbae]RKF23624.1 hypothetical protein D7I43_30550 [Micromonospora globbae]
MSDCRILDNNTQSKSAEHSAIILRPLVGHTERPAPLDELRAAPDSHFIKTHRQRDPNVHEDDRAICLVRDGRDALVSWARQASEDDPSRYEDELRAKILSRSATGTGSWGSNILSWLRPPAPHRQVLRYEDLTTAPAVTVQAVIAALIPTLTPLVGAVIPSLAELRQADNQFFRRGRTGTHRDELPDYLHELFWSRADNRTAMHLLGYHMPKPGGE